MRDRNHNVHNDHKSENMNKEEIEENFRDITAGIHKLRMDSNAELSPLLKDVSINFGPVEIICSDL